VKTYGSRLKEARNKKGLMQHELAELSGISQVTISSIENFHSESYLDTAIKFAKALDVSLDWLATGEEQENKMTTKSDPTNEQIKKSFKDLGAAWKYIVPRMDPCQVGCIVTYVLAFKKDKSPEAVAAEICKSFWESKGGIDETK